MPRKYATRIEFHPSRETHHKLELFLKKAKEKHGRYISMSRLVNAIVEDFLRDEEKHPCFLEREE